MYGLPYGDIRTLATLTIVVELASSCIAFAFIAGLGADVALASHRGEDVHGRAIVARTMRRIVPLVGIRVSTGLLSLLGLACLVVPGIYAYLVLSLASAVCMHERLGVGDSLARSEALTGGTLLRLLGLLCIANLPRLVLYVVRVAFATYVASKFAADIPFTIGLKVALRAPPSAIEALLHYGADVFVSVASALAFGAVYIHLAKVPSGRDVSGDIAAFA